MRNNKVRVDCHARICEVSMRRGVLVLMLIMPVLSMSYAQPLPPAETQSSAEPTPAASQQAEGKPSWSTTARMSSGDASEHLGLHNKFRFYLGETYLNPSFITAPAVRAGIRMASPPGRIPSAYPADWRQGPEGFGRNYGDALAQRVSFETARFVSGALVHEDPRYAASSSHNPFLRSLHAFGFAFLDQSDFGHRMPAFSSFVGAAAAGFVGNTYLPPGFNNVTHAGQRATLQFGLFASGNLYREFALQMPRPLRIFIGLIGR
jgi:hypothetical protein